MNKPIMKQEVAILVSIKSVRQIVFFATNDAVSEFAPYGNIIRDDNVREKYSMFVDARYDFDEVLEYMQGYGQ